MYIGKKPTAAPLTSSDIAADIINSTHIGDTAISGFDALATEPADTDEFLISDGGVLKRLDASLIGGGGKIGQVIQTHKADGFSTTNGVTGTGFTDITGLSATITPSATSSKILIMGSIDVSESSSNRILLRLKRGSTVIGNASDSGMSSQEVHKHVFNTGTASGQNNMSVNFLDSPSTTSATTYQFSVTNNQLDNNSTIYVNRNANSGSGNQDAHSTSQITLMEILA